MLSRRTPTARASFATLLLAVLLGACGDDTGNDGDSDTAGDAGDAGDSDAGDSDAADGDSAGDGGEPVCGTLRAVIRDFPIAHPDFEIEPQTDVVVRGIVNPTITPGGTPTLSPTSPGNDNITDAATFAQWYADVPGVNQRFEEDLVLTEGPAGNFVYDSDAYFPIDGEGFGNEGNAHNYHFTTELHAAFTYTGGESFTFRGDDDVWVFVNGRLAIDIGGIHSANEATIDFDAQAAALGIEPNNTYAIDFFQAERHVTGSNFRIQTTIGCFIVL